VLCVVVAVVVGAGTVVVTTVVTVMVGVVDVVVVPLVVVPDVVVPPVVVVVPVVAVVVVVVVVVSLCEVLPATADAENVPSAASAPSAIRMQIRFTGAVLSLAILPFRGSTAAYSENGIGSARRSRRS
jgi:hypothetical protein